VDLNTTLRNTLNIGILTLILLIWDQQNWMLNKKNLELHQMGIRVYTVTLLIINQHLRFQICQALVTDQWSLFLQCSNEVYHKFVKWQVSYSLCTYKEYRPIFTCAWCLLCGGLSSFSMKQFTVPSIKIKTLSYSLILIPVRDSVFTKEHFKRWNHRQSIFRNQENSFIGQTDNSEPLRCLRWGC
jgi:hypothetical protein